MHCLATRHKQETRSLMRVMLKYFRIPTRGEDYITRDLRSCDPQQLKQQSQDRKKMRTQSHFHTEIDLTQLGKEKQYLFVPIHVLHGAYLTRQKTWRIFKHFATDERFLIMCSSVCRAAALLGCTIIATTCLTLTTWSNAFLYCCINLVLKIPDISKAGGVGGGKALHLKGEKGKGKKRTDHLETNAECFTLFLHHEKTRTKRKEKISPALEGYCIFFFCAIVDTSKLYQRKAQSFQVRL